MVVVGLNGSKMTDYSGKLDLFGRFQYKITKNQAFLQ